MTGGGFQVVDDDDDDDDDDADDNVDDKEDEGDADPLLSPDPLPRSFCHRNLDKNRGDFVCENGSNSRIMQFLGLIGVARCRSFGSDPIIPDLIGYQVNPEVHRPQGR